MSNSQAQGQVIKNIFFTKGVIGPPHFHGISTGKSFYGIMFVIKVTFKVNFEVKYLTILFLKITNINHSSYGYIQNSLCI